MSSPKVLLRAQDIVKHFDSRRGWWGRATGNPGSLVQAVNGVSLDIHAGETLGLIGESGCGKSTLGRTLLWLHKPTAGRIEFDNRDIAAMSAEELMRLRRRMQIVFQDPYASLNPRKTVAQLIGLPLHLHGLSNTNGRVIREQVATMLQRVGLDASILERYPHQFSGGQRQRLGIARALILEPEFLVCDEPVSALDVSIQAQILELLAELKSRLGLTYLFISHDITVIAHVSDRIAVMYLGKIVEYGSASAILQEPRHPYTRALLSAVPKMDGVLGTTRHRIHLQGDLPSPIEIPRGCAFHTRCPIAEDRCVHEIPTLRPVLSAQSVACHRSENAPPIV